MTLPVEVNPLLLGGGVGDYRIERSLRFRSAAAGGMQRTLSANSTSSTTCTWSMWIKRADLGVARSFVAINSNSGGSGNIVMIEFVSDTIRVGFDGGLGTMIQTSAVYRDPSAWYHIVLAYDSTQATASNRARLFVNGSQVTSFSTASYPALNQAFSASASNIQSLGSFGSLRFEGYLAEVNFIDGQGLTPSSFGQSDPVTGVWVPRRYAGSYGTNGFYLKFTDNSAATAATIGKDFSGNGNNLTPSNISVTAGATNDSMIDVPTNYGDGGNGRGNYAVLSPLDWVGAANTLSAGNLDLTTSAAVISAALGTFFVSSGKWYWEFTVGGVAGICQVGIAKTPVGVISTNGPYQSANVYTYVSSNGNKGNNNTTAAYGATYTTGDVIGVALDMDAGTLAFYKNNVSQGTAYSGLTGEFAPLVGDSGNASTISGNANFGQRPFAYTPPSGFLALNTQNLPAPIIQNGARHFDAATYTGTGASRSITGELFSPDLVWIKSRSAGTDHAIYDTARGVQLQLESNTTGAETTEATGLTAFNADGFTIGALAQVNTSAATYVAWQWDEGVTPGFDIVTYTGTGSARTVAHNLGVAPRFVIVKARNNTAADQWGVYHGALPNTQNLYLNLTNAAATASMWNSTSPTSAVFSLGANNDVNRSSINYVAYVWAEVSGFSRFGSYVGNGSTDGPFVWCGFRPRWVLVKRSDSSGNWVLLDTSMNPSNVANLELIPNSTFTENTNAANDLDFVSGGFKLRNTNADYNASGATYVFAAFAENPFKIARAR